MAALGNTIEERFGLQGLIGKKLFVANDIKGNFGLDPGDLQMMTSLERMSVPVKFGTAQTLKWDVPGIFAGNDLPYSWKDKLNSMARRLVLIQFTKPIRNRDNSLKNKIRDSQAALYRLCVLAYQDWITKHGSDDIWAYAPKKIVKGQKIVKQQGNPLEMFLDSTEVKIGCDGAPAHHVKQDAFLKRLKDFCNRFGHNPPKTSTTELRPILKIRGCKLVQGKSMEWPLGSGTPIVDTFFTNIELVDRVADPDDD